MAESTMSHLSNNVFWLITAKFGIVNEARYIRKRLPGMYSNAKICILQTSSSTPNSYVLLLY